MLFKNVVNALTYYKFLLFEALIISFIVEAFLKLGIYNPLKQLHHSSLESNSEDEIAESEFDTIWKVAKIMRLLERHAFWKPNCYNRALTAKKLLTNRKISSNLAIGFRKKDKQYDGHAWLTHKGHFITGKVKNIEHFKVLSSY